MPRRRELAHSGAPRGDARRAALQLLEQVLDAHRPLDQALAAPHGAERLEPRDRAFTRALIATVLRRLGQIDAVLDRFLARPLPPRARKARHILRPGATQLLFLGTPPHAAVDASVGLAEGAELAGFRGLINAVLRRVANEGPALIADQDAARLNTTDWLWRSWEGAYGPGTCRAIAQAHLAEPPLDFSVRADARAWADALGGELMPTGSVRRPASAGGSVEGLPGYADGAWWVQDAAAALPARLLGSVKGQRVIDLCAAPGGKTAQLAAAGAKVVAVDRSPERLKRVAANLARLRLTAELVAADAVVWRPGELADGVLLDAPCSATGTIRRHPDLLRQKRAEDLAALTALQDRLLRAAAEMIGSGGVLVYSVCSLEPEEGPARVAAFLESGAPFERVPLRVDEIAGLPPCAIADSGDLRTLPSQWAERGGWDGFYAARLRRL